MGMHVCTIIARNYLASARVLFDSFNKSNPDGTLTVLVVDDVSRKIENGSEPFEILHTDQIEIEETEVLKMAALYNVTEFATAVKPWLIHTLINRWNEPVIYLDPDIMVFRSLERVRQLASEHQIVVTPHAAQPIPRDKLRVSESEILAAGIYNLGFIAIGVSGIQFLEFWKERLKRECISDPTNMRFVDQRWVDFAPAMFDTFILKDPTYNVAYWNLHYLDFGVDQESGSYLVNGEPIHFFHFSGYNPRVPELLSKYQGGNARILFSECPQLKGMCDDYRHQLFKNDYKESISIKYAYASLSNGMHYDNYMRSAYREALLESEEQESATPPNPYVSADLFLLWLNSRRENMQLSRYLEQVYESRRDLKEHFPDANGSGLYSLLAWCWDEASKGNFDSRLIPTEIDFLDEADNTAAADTTLDSRAHGIEIAGYFRAEMGLGELARSTVAAVAATGIPYSTLTDSDVIHRQNHEFSDLEGNAHAVNIVCMNADSLTHFAYRMGTKYFQDRYTIGIWAWELEEFPEAFDSSFEYVDEIWGISEFTKNAIAQRSLKPVYAMPVTVNPPNTVKDFDLSTLGIPKGYTFLFCFDLLSIYERKNPLALIDAFTKAFTEGEGPVLVIKALNGDKKLADLEKIKIRAHGRSDIIIVDKYLDYADNVGLFSASDCYVSLHRSEGLGLTIAEAMSLGKPVIATAYSGNLDFMDSDNSFLVSYTYGNVPEGCDPYRPGAKWAEPDINEASDLMRWVYENQDEAAAVGERARKDMLENHSPRSLSTFIAERYRFATATLNAKEDSGSLNETHEGFSRNVQNEPIEPATAPPLIALAARPITYDGKSRLPKLSKFVRSGLRKLLFTRDNQQQEFNMAIALGTEHLARLRNEMQAQIDRLTDERLRDEQIRQSFETRIERLTKIYIDEISRRELLSRSLVDINSRIDELKSTDSELKSNFNGLDTSFNGLDTSLAEMASYLKVQLQSIPYMADPETFIREVEGNKEALGYEEAGGDASGYARFEDLFRGPEDFIRERQFIYLEHINPSKQVIDIGCGRGEFLDVLKHANMSGVGVDLDESMVRRASERGHTIIKQDAIDFLKDQKSQSISTIFSAQFVEHLDFQQLCLFIDESFKALDVDGVLIMETVNPYSMPAFRTFWTDLSHERPIFPEVLLALVREAGFPRAHVLFPNGSGNLESDRWSEGEYAVIAHR